jgi:tetratricopeptide (TPR) repeat protein
MKSKLLLCVCGLALAALVLVAAVPEKKGGAEEAARLNNLGCAYMNQQLFEKALNSFQAAAAADPNLHVARFNQGVALSSLGRIDDARQILEQATKDSPKDPHVWYALGMLDKNSSDPQAAVEDFKRVIEIDDSDADTWYFLGTVYSQIKEFPKAIDAFEHALKLNPLHASAQFGLSRAYQQSGQSAQAREHLTRFQYITQHKLGSAMSLAYGEQGKYSLCEESAAAVQKVPPQIPVKFVDVTKAAGIIGTSSSGTTKDYLDSLASGACFLDYDNDGRIDLLLADNGPEGGVALLHNIGGGKFEDSTKKSGLDSAIHAIGCTAGDYDNDGFSDVALAARDRVVLLHNEKNETFKDVTASAEIVSAGPNASATFVDYDHDGDVDLYITRIGQLTDRGKLTSQSTSPAVTLFNNLMFRNNGNGTFADVTDEKGLGGAGLSIGAVGADYNNDRAVDVVTSGFWPTVFENPREGKFLPHNDWFAAPANYPNFPKAGMAVLDFDHDGWMDIAFSRDGRSPAVELWRNNHGKSFEQVKLPETNWARAYGIAAFDYDNDGWVDLVAVGETKDGKGEIKLFRNLGPDGWKDVTADVGLDKIQLNEPRAIITGDYDNDGATDLLITQNHGPAVLLKNEGGNKNNWLRLALKGLNDNKSAIGTKVEVFSDGIRQKYEIYGSNGYLGQNSPYLTVGLGKAKQADVVRLLWPTGVLQDEVEIAANQQKELQEIDRRGSSCPTLFVWNGKHYELVADVLGAGVIGHWVAPGETNIARPVEWVKVDRNLIEPKAVAPSLSRSVRQGGVFDFPKDQETRPVSTKDVETRTGPPVLSFRLMEPMEEVVYLDAVKLVAVDHPVNEEVYPNEYFASNPPYPKFKVITSQNAKPPAGAWDDKGNNLLPDLLAHKYVGNFDLLPFKGFTKPHSLILDLGEPYRGGPLRLLMHGEIEYFTATGMYAASQAGVEATAPYVEAEASNHPVGRTFLSDKSSAQNHMDKSIAAVSDRNVRRTQATKWVRVSNDMGFPAGLPRTITTELGGKLPLGTRRIRITTNLQIYWDSILVDRSPLRDNYRLSTIPLNSAKLDRHGYPLQIEDQPPGNVKYVYEDVSRTGPYARQAGEYTRYGEVLPLLKNSDDKLVVFGSGEEVQLEFDPASLPALPKGWTRDYFFMANGYEKDMDFYAAHGSTVEPLPFKEMGTYPYRGKAFPNDQSHVDYMLKYNTRFVSGNEPTGYSYEYSKGK